MTSSLKLYSTFVVFAILWVAQESEANFCANPKTASNIDFKWLGENVKGGWKIQFANPPLRARFAQWLLGRVVRSDEDYSQMCAKDIIKFVENGVIGNFTGFGDKVAKYSCLSTSLNFGCDIISTNEGYNDAAKIHLSYFDDKKEHNLMGVVFCFQNGDTGIMALTAGNSLSPKETEDVVKHFNSNGLKTDDRVPMYTNSCKE